MRLATLSALLLAVGVVSACASSNGSPSAGATLGSAPPLPPTTSPEASRAATSPPHATAAPSAMGLDDWSAAQLFLMAGAPPGIRPSCVVAPRLPEVAYDGVQCKGPGYTIGYYAFDEREEMRKVYFDRLAEHGVTPDSGEMCFDGAPGEGVDTPGNEGFELHLGCFIDESGLANARMIFASDSVGESVYVGATGDDGSIEHLFAALFPDYEPGSTGCGWCAGQIWSPPGEWH